MTDHRPTRIAGVERGTGALALATCLAFSIGIAMLTQSLFSTLVACASIVAGVTLVLNILPHRT
ncbi:hypothetical protein OHA40_33385 [Nocardia sp. NBC_00508]|uniref:hypothetical protein n=1 Tax=Nocardia sp. NBC_00508 TaxID=2975992 RepID=UPI002E820B73|nr:hypothetical protein [Nocardia sp. NBC_00508]WUD66380.1 hypothetical protein OHA40_33385 [Nocardia sp. NBC_00508]